MDQNTIKIQKARAMGVPEALIQQRWGNTQPQAQPQAESQGPGLADLLPIIGAIGGSFIPGLGNIVGGALGAGAGTLLKQGFQGKGDLGEVVKETALGGVGGVIGKGLGVGAKLLGKGVTKSAEGLGIKSLRLQPSQLTKFQARHKEDVGQFLTKENALGKGAKELAEQHIKPLQESFNTIAKKSGLTATPDDFLKNVDEEANRLIQAGGSENATLAEKVRQEAQYLWEKDLAPSKFDISKVDSLRKTFATKVNWNNPEKATVDYAIANALRNTTINTAENAGYQGLKEIGVKLSKFRDLEEFVTAQENLGRGNLPGGIRSYLSLLAGAQARGAIGGPTGAIAGLGINALAGSPAVLRGATKAGTALGGKLQQGLPQGISAPLGQSAARLGGTGGELVPEVEASEGQPMDGEGIPSQGGGSDEALRRAFFMAMLQNPKQAATLKTIYEFGYPQGKTSATKEKNIIQTNTADNIATQIEKAYKGIGQTGRISGLVQKGSAVAGFNPKVTAYEALRLASIGPLARSISSEVGVLTDRDIARAEQLLPKVTDTPEEARLKFKALKEAITQRRKAIKGAPSSSEIPLPQNLEL